jgi:dCMP deaminase
MTVAVVAYVPVLHEGYRRFVERHATGRPLHVLGHELYADYRPLAKDIRALDPELAAAALAAWGIASAVSVLTPAAATALAAQRASLVLPAEDVSYRVVERYFERCEVWYDSVFLRWDRSKTVQLLEPMPSRVAALPEAVADLGLAAEAAAGRSLDWWRQVGAAIRFVDGETRTASNEHVPDPIAPYVVGDPRSNFYQGVHLELSTAMHAEARLIAEAAREGRPVAEATMFVTDFPCPPCAKLIAAAGVSRLYFCDGYAILDGKDVLAAAGVDVVGLGSFG